MSPSTGIIYNDEMDDFSYPAFRNDFNLPPSPREVVNRNYTFLIKKMELF